MTNEQFSLFERKDGDVCRVVDNDGRIFVGRVINNDIIGIAGKNFYLKSLTLLGGYVTVVSFKVDEIVAVTNLTGIIKAWQSL